MSTDHRGNPTGTNNAAKTNAERVGRVPSQQELDQHTIAHADGFVGPRVSESWGSNPMRPGIVTYTTKSGWGSDGHETRMQQDPAIDHMPEATHSRAGSRGTAARMAHLDNVGVGIKRNATRMYQHKGTGSIIESRDSYGGGTQTNEYGTTASGKSLSVDKDSSLSGVAHKSGAPSDPQNKPDEWTDISDTVRGTRTYKENRVN